MTVPRLDTRLPFDLRAIEVFLAVCETGAMAAAARLLGTTQPAVSQTIAEIEARSGVRLFDRGVRPLALTPAGVVLRQRASPLLAEARQIPALLRETRRGRFPLIRIGIVDSLSRILVGELARFLGSEAEQAAILSGLTALHASALLTRRLDMVIGVDELAEVDGLERWPVLDEPYLLLCPGGLDAPTTVPGLERLAAASPLIRFSARSKTGAEIDQHLRRLRLDLPRRQEFDTPYAVTAAVAAGLGWAITTPLCLIEAGLPLGELGLIPLPGPLLSRRLTLVARAAELGPLPRQVVALTRAALRSEGRSFVARHCLWIGDRFAVES